MARVLPRAFFDRAAVPVAPDLIGKVLQHRSADGVVAARVVEVEAYRGASDPAAHSFRGPTRRNASMFGPPGHLHVYFVYGMHWCVNVVCGPGDQPHAVLLRAAMTTAGLDAMQQRRPRAARAVDLLRGPANLATAMGLDGRHDGAPLRGAITLRDDGFVPAAIATSTRVGLGVGKGDDLELRWFVVDDPHVSRHPTADRRSARAMRAPDLRD